MFSSTISDTDTAVASQYNNLRLDVFDTTGGHDHDGTSSGGKKVSHGDLLDDAAIINTYLTHSMLNKHVQGTGTSSNPDAVGGDTGCHGLPASAKIAGSVASPAAQYCIQAGTATLSAGTGSPPTGSPPTKSVVFADSGAAFSTLIAVVVSHKGDIADDYQCNSLFVTAQSATGFTVKSWAGVPYTSWTFASTEFNWVAIGVM